MRRGHSRSSAVEMRMTVGDWLGGREGEGKIYSYPFCFPEEEWPVDSQGGLVGFGGWDKQRV